MKKFIIEKIEAALPEKSVEKSDHKSDPDLVKRLYDLGLHPGLTVEVVARISFNSVTVIQYGNTRLALNEEEFACLHGRS